MRQVGSRMAATAGAGAGDADAVRACCGDSRGAAEISADGRMTAMQTLSNGSVVWGLAGYQWDQSEPDSRETGTR